MRNRYKIFFYFFLLFVGNRIYAQQSINLLYPVDNSTITFGQPLFTWFAYSNPFGVNHPIIYKIKLSERNIGQTKAYALNTNMVFEETVSFNSYQLSNNYVLDSCSSYVWQVKAYNEVTTTGEGGSSTQEVLVASSDIFTFGYQCNPIEEITVQKSYMVLQKKPSPFVFACLDSVHFKYNQLYNDSTLSVQILNDTALNLLDSGYVMDNIKIGFNYLSLAVDDFLIPPVRNTPQQANRIYYSLIATNKKGEIYRSRIEFLDN